ncbi:ankyrin repeat-containing protein [Acanthamoeba castellanii str. Neff]|uniref:Ankyrin repeat-containing protein n=1 Tax=Acanthamoeba castellanii (strain ATCC 30010 / Neff) TaxID=1257118 RepID=L8HJD9_ACACF|nr:ankyrin repeat-containing protein [Acanthamoeba castellanii str. Neff]ELR25327.1 ankyrin repeat-containing protein [Acanthamoeba castellanii str. Neff]
MEELTDEEFGGGLEGLPVEIQQFIITLLVGHKGALFAAGLTCRLWHLLTLEDMVWRKYAVEEWGALLPHHHHSPHEQQRQDNDWLMMAFRRWRNPEAAKDAKEHTTRRDWVRETVTELAATAMFPAARIHTCVRRGLKKPIEEWTATGHLVSSLVVAACDTAVPAEILKLLLATPNAVGHEFAWLHPYGDADVDSATAHVPLLAAVKADNAAAVGMLLEAGASIYHPVVCSPLHYAVYSGAPKAMLERMLRPGGGGSRHPSRILAGFNPRPDVRLGWGYNWNLHFEKSTPLIEACASGNLDAMDVFLAWRDPSTEEPVRINHQVGDDLLLWVAVESLFKHVLPPETAPDPAKQALRNERLWEMLRTLLTMGADPNLQLGGQVLLAWVLRQPLFLQTQEFVEKLVGLLMEHKALAAQPEMKSGDSPMHVAAREERHLNAMRRLLQSDVNIDVPNKQGRTPVHEALLKGKLEMAALLETHGADMQLPDVYGVTPEQLKGRQQAGVGDSRPAFDIFSLPPAPVTALPVAAAGSARSRAGSFSAAANIADDGDDEAWTRETFSFGFGEDPSSATTATFGSSPTFSLHLGTTSTSTSASSGTTAPAPAPTFPSSAPLTVPPSLSSSSSSAPGGGVDVGKLSFTPPSFETIAASVVSKQKNHDQTTNKPKTGKKDGDDPIEGLVAQFNWEAMGISSKDTNHRLNLKREPPEICLFPPEPEPEPAPELEPEPVVRGQIMHDLETFGFAFGSSSSPASFKLDVGPTTTANATSSPAAAAVVDPTNTAEPEPEAVKAETNDGPATHETFSFGFALGGHEDGTSASTTTTTSSSPAMFALDIGPTTATPAATAGAAPLFAAAPVPSSASSANGGAEPFKLSFTPPSFETILASAPKKSADTKKRPKKKDEEGDPIADLTKAFNWAALGIAPDDTASKLQRRLAWGEKSKNV